MTLQQLNYVIAVVNAGSLNRAAEQLFVSQPSLSSAIHELESELKLLLFVRSSRGMRLTEDGVEFLKYARQITEQMDLLAQRYFQTTPRRRLCAVSTQHYAFVVRAFANMVASIDAPEYDFTLRETQTHEILEDVKQLRSEIGVLYTNPFNQNIIQKLLKEAHLGFTPLFHARPHIFTSAESPLAGRASVTLEELEDYPYLVYEQGPHNSFYFAEEMQSTVVHRKNIRVNDRATMFNLMLGLNGYTICSGLLNADLNGGNLIAIPLEVEDLMTVGYITNLDAGLSQMGERFLAELHAVIQSHGYRLHK